MKRRNLILVILILVLTCKRNKAPKDLVILSPPFSYKDSMVHFSVKASDPEKEDISYMFDWGDGSQSNWSKFLPSDSFYVDSHAFSDTLEFLVRAKAKDKGGNESGWETKKFKVLAFEPGRVLWRFICEEGNFVSSPSLDTFDGTIYCACSEGHLHALKPDGKEKWRFETESGIISTPLVLENRQIVFGNEDGDLYCLSPSGGLVWAISLGVDVSSSPALGQDENIYLSTQDSIYLINSSSGQILQKRWRRGGSGLSSPAVSREGTIFVGGDVFSTYRPDLEPKWEVELEEEVASSPSLDGNGRVYFGSLDGSFYCLDNNSGETLFKRYFYEDLTSSPVIFNNLILQADSRGLYCFTTANSDSWEVFFGDGIPSTPLVSDAGVVYLAVDYGKKGEEDSIFAFSLSSGERLFATPVNLSSEEEIVSSPAISKEGILYLGEEGGLVAIVGLGKFVSNHWPCFRRDVNRTGRYR